MKLRDDLIISPQEGVDGTVYVIKDPVTNRFFRFKEAEHFIAQQFDGVTAPETVRKRVEEKFGVALSSENLNQFVLRLQGIGLLTDEKSGVEARPQRPRRSGGDAFYWRYRLFDPEHFFDWLLPKIGFFFTPYFLLLSAALLSFAAGVTVIHWGEMKHQLKGMFHFEFFLLAWFVLLAVIALHEFAHGLTCRHFGGRVREIGFLLIYFQPAFYCNVSDAWLFPEKSKRLWVTFAGAYFEMFLWAIATLVWWMTEPATTLNQLALLVNATSAVKSLFNVNPLIKLDGYYLLSDYLGVPNLRGKAFACLGDQFRRLLGSAVRKVPDATAREKWIFLLYSSLAGTYSLWLFGWVLSALGAFLVQRYQGWGFAGFALLLAAIFRRPLKKNLAVFAGSLGYDARVIPARTKRIFWLALLCAGVVSLFVVHMELKISGSFNILPVHNADVRAEVEGIIAEVFVDEGETVKTGDRIARLSDRDYRAELRKTLSEIDEKEARLKLLKAGPREEEIELARTLVAKADERIGYARKRVDTDALLYSERIGSQRELETSKEQLALREKELQEAQDSLRVLLAGSRKEEIEATEAELHRLKSQQAYLEEQLKSLDVVSPINGVVTTHKLKEKVGQNVKKGDLIATVHELDTVTAEIAVSEKDIADVKVGQDVMLKARAYPGASFHGRVTSIAPVAEKRDEWRDDRMVIVVTRLDNAAGQLKSEMTGNAKISCGQQRLFDLITRRFVRFLRVEMWSWW